MRYINIYTNIAHFPEQKQQKYRGEYSLLERQFCITLKIQSTKLLKPFHCRSDSVPTFGTGPTRTNGKFLKKSGWTSQKVRKNVARSALSRKDLARAGLPPTPADKFFESSIKDARSLGLDGFKTRGS